MHLIDCWFVVCDISFWVSRTQLNNADKIKYPITAELSFPMHELIRFPHPRKY